MKRSQMNNAVLKQKFYFRRNIITSNTPACCVQMCSQEAGVESAPNGTASNTGKMCDFVFSNELFYLPITRK